MSKVLSLKSFRKRKARDEKRRQGAENAAVFGFSKAQKSLDDARNEKTRRDHDGHKKE